MLTRPRFKPHLRAQVVPGEGAFVVADGVQTVLKGRLYELLVPAIDGRPADALCDQFDASVSPAELYYVLGQLEKRGFLCEACDALPDEEAAFWSAQQVDPNLVATRLAGKTVAVRAFGIDPAPFLDLLRASRIRIDEEGELDIVLADTYLRDELDAVNTQALATGKPWLLVQPCGRQPWIGPLFRPVQAFRAARADAENDDRAQGACWACLAQRLRDNRPVENYLHGKAGTSITHADRAATHASLHAALALAANAAATWIVRGDVPALENTLLTLDLASWQFQSHAVVRLLHCPACGSRRPLDRDVAPIRLEPRPKRFTRDGGHRGVAPETTLERFGHHVSPLTGAVTMLERVRSPGDGALHVYIAGRNLARRHASLDQLRTDLRNMSAGKGATDAQARASGLCEGLERYSGVFRGDEPRLTATLKSLRGRASHPNDCALFSDRQYRERGTLRKGHYNFVPAPFDPDRAIEWTPLWSLTRNAPHYLPTAFCYFSYPHGRHDAFAIGDSNGNAAGNTLEEAILQGFLELVERDSVALWWYNRVRRPALDLDGFADPYPAQVRDVLRDLGRDVWALDLTSDLGIPVVASLCRNREGPEEQIILGFGAHLDPQVALLRALTEMNQMLATLLIQPASASPQNGDRNETEEWLRTATVANQPYLLPNAESPRGASAFPRTWTDDVAEDVRFCQKIVENEGLEFLVLDQTRAEIGLPVVKVVVPGLRHFWARFAPGRLYDVPVALGWLDRPLTEDELNPIPMFL